MGVVIIGPLGENVATRLCVFGEIVEGRVPDAYYINRARKGMISSLIRRFATAKWMPLRLKCAIRHPWEVNYGMIAPLLKAGEANAVVFCPSTHPFERISGALIRNLRRNQPDCRLFFYLIDGVERTARINKCSVEQVITFLKQFDTVLTYDPSDASKYGYGFMDIPVWSPAEVDEQAAEDCDLYFSGRNKGRERLLESIRDRLTKEGVNVKLSIVGKGGKHYAGSAVSIEPWRPYPEVAREASRARCILEILADNNTGSTLRYREAVIYNKKLLTNNPDIARLPYYDARWMRTFEGAEDIDIDWLMRNDSVQYGYRGDFSAACFIEKIKGML